MSKRFPEFLKLGGHSPLFEDLGKSSHNRGSNTARLALLIAAGVGAAGAKESRTEFAVTATVRAVAHMELESAPAALQISEVDIQRGFVDVLQATQFTVRSNSPSGFALEVLTLSPALTSPVLTSMTVAGLESEQSLGAQGGTIVERWQKPQAVKLSLKFRFTLAPGVRAGRYEWPVRLAVRPLEAA